MVLSYVTDKDTEPKENMHWTYFIDWRVYLYSGKITTSSTLLVCTREQKLAFPTFLSTSINC